MDHLTDLQDQAVGRLATQYRGKAGVEGLVRALTGEAQALEDGIWGLVTDRELDPAVGVQLDGYGAIVGEPRAGRDDDTYRVWIKVRRLVNRSSGTAEDLLGCYAVLLAGLSSYSAVLTEFFPAALVLRIAGGAVDRPSDYGQILQEAKAAGVKATFEWSGTAPELTFTFLGGPGLGFDTLTNPGHGGLFAEAVE